MLGPNAFFLSLLPSTMNQENFPCDISSYALPKAMRLTDHRLKPLNLWSQKKIPMPILVIRHLLQYGKGNTELSSQLCVKKLKQIKPASPCRYQAVLPFWKTYGFSIWWTNTELLMLLVCSPGPCLLAFILCNILCGSAPCTTILLTMRKQL